MTGEWKGLGRGVEGKNPGDAMKGGLGKGRGVILLRNVVNTYIKGEMGRGGGRLRDCVIVMPG